MSGDYLWDKTGEPEPEVKRLEEALAPLAYKERSFEAPAEGAPRASSRARPDAPEPEAARAPKGRRSSLFARFGMAAAAALGVALGLLGILFKLKDPPAQSREVARPAPALLVNWERVADALAAEQAADARAAGFVVERLEGAPLVGSRPVEAQGKLAPGQWLETDPQSKARVAIADIGRVMVASSTRLRLVATGPEEHRLDLARGRISAEVVAPPRLFIVGTPAATAVDLGCAYSLEVDDHGGGSLQVTSGWVALEAPGRSSLVPAGAECRTKQGIGPGTPVFTDASEALKSALGQLDFGEAAKETLAVVLKEARPRDSLTLWHLLFRVDARERRSVLARLRSLSPPPPGVAERDALELQKPKLNAWLDDLAKSW